jgi:hypothetical protein
MVVLRRWTTVLRRWTTVLRRWITVLCRWTIGREHGRTGRRLGCHKVRGALFCRDTGATGRGRGRDLDRLRGRLRGHGRSRNVAGDLHGARRGVCDLRGSRYAGELIGKRDGHHPGRIALSPASRDPIRLSRLRIGSRLLGNR